MKLENAIKKVEKAGFTVYENNGFYTCKKEGHADVKFMSNSDGTKAQCFNTGETFVKNITAAITISKK